MTITREPPEDDRVSPGGADAAFTLESIQKVQDFTARKTLEQAHAFVTGLAQIIEDAGESEDDRATVDDLSQAGIGAPDAAQIEAEALALMALIADRDRKAEIFHAAVKEAAQRERAMYERLAMLARTLRSEIGVFSPALAKLGVPSLGVESQRGPKRSPGKAIFSAMAIK